MAAVIKAEGNGGKLVRPWIGAAGEIMPEVLKSAALPAAVPLVLRIEDGENPRLDLPLPQGNLPQVYERFAAACARLTKGQTAIP